MTGARRSEREERAWFVIMLVLEWVLLDCNNGVSDGGHHVSASERRSRDAFAYIYPSTKAH